MAGSRRRRTRHAAVAAHVPAPDDPEHHPLWGLFGVWGRVLLVFGVIGHVLWLGSLLIGWPMHKFLTHVLGSGLLLLFSRPRYSPMLSPRLSSGLSPREVDDLRRAVDTKMGLTRPPAARPPTGAGGAGDSAPTAAVQGGLGWLGSVFAWALGRRN